MKHLHGCRLIAKRRIWRGLLTACPGLLVAVLLAASEARAHEDVIEGPHGVERAPDPLRGQGWNIARDRAYASWGQYEDNTTTLLTRPRGRRSIRVGEALRFAKRVWKVNILDESGDPRVRELRFTMGLGAVEREMALPLFVESLTMAVEALPGVYVVRDEAGGHDFGWKNYARGTIHIRKARPLQPDYEHPWDADRSAIRKLEKDLRKASKPLAGSERWTTDFERRDMDFQAAVAALLERYQAGAIKNRQALLDQFAKLRRTLRHARTRWLSKHGPRGLDPREGKAARAAAKEAAPAAQEKTPAGAGNGAGNGASKDKSGGKKSADPEKK